MRSLSRIVLTILVGFCFHASVFCARHSAAYASSAGNESIASNSNSQTQRATPRQLTPSEWDDVTLGRAVDRWLKSDLRGAAELLETIDISPSSAFPHADRAAFLLAVAYLKLDDTNNFHRVANLSADPGGSPYRQWIRYCQLSEQGSDKTDHLESRPLTRLPKHFAGAVILEAAFLIESQRFDSAVQVLESHKPEDALSAIHLFVLAQAHEAAGDDAAPVWRRLADFTPKNTLDADFVGAALMRLSIARLQSGLDPTELLQRVPKFSRYVPRAAHLMGLVAIEAGEVERGRKILTQVLTTYPWYTASSGGREIKLALGNAAMDQGHWKAALRFFERSGDNWGDEYNSLGYLESDSLMTDVWTVWDRGWRDEIRLESSALVEAIGKLATSSLDLRDDPPLTPDNDLAKQLWPSTKFHGATASWDSSGVLLRHHPLPEEWDAIRAVRQQRRRVQGELAHQQRVVADLENAIQRRLDYLHVGADRAASSVTDLTAAAARLANLLAVLDANVAELRSARDNAMLEVAVRTRDMVEELRREILFMHALRHFHVKGPREDRPERFPTGVPSPAELLVRDEQLALESERFLTFFAAHYDSVIAQSFAGVWEPRLTGGTRQLRLAVLMELARARDIRAGIDSTMTWHANDPALANARAYRNELAEAVDVLRRRESDLRFQIAQNVAARGREQLKSEQQAIDYHLADASYELAIEAATDTATAEVVEYVAPLRRQAISRLQTFLTRHPQSFARGETRYRLADLQLMQAREDFQTNMAAYLGEQPAAEDLGNRALAPFVNYAPVITLYEQILAEDHDFPHLDAVLFNIGMILTDDGQAAGTEYLTRYVNEFPDSPDTQEAWLRMGSDRFDQKDYAGCIPFFENAIAGDDPSFTAIALYKLGWARFEGDSFHQSADAFRRLIDLYNDHSDVAKAMDLRDEAEEYLVHSLARNGGADAFRDYFDGIGWRDYEPQILLGLGHLMRSLSLYEEAVACDALWLGRYPSEARTLAVAERMVDTYKSWNKPDTARRLKFEHASRFLPGSDWFEKNKDPELRNKGNVFARSAYRETATFHHRAARENDHAQDWTMALSNYERYIQHWPDADDATNIHYYAGEAASHLGNFPLSLEHYDAATRSDSAAVAIDATWQRIAVTDAWYQTTQPSPAHNGSDSLAVNLIAAGQMFVDRYPEDKRCSDILWRQGNLAYAHGWYENAADRLLFMGQTYPDDPRAMSAVRMGADAHYRRSDFDAAGVAYEKALALAQAARNDTLIADFQKRIPLCYYKHAESIADADPKNGEKSAAVLFARVAQQWPHFEHADLALYRAGLGFAERGSTTEAADSWSRLLADHADSEYARDSAAELARLYETAGDAPAAAAAYETFSELYPEDPDAPAALLKSIDLLTAAGNPDDAEKMRSVFLERFPGQTEAVMEIRAARVAKELEAVSAGSTTLSALLAAAPSTTGTTDVGAGVYTSQLQAYLTLAAENPELASPAILSRVDFLTAEEVFGSYASLPLTQPLPAAIEKKKTKLEEVMNAYNRCVEHGVAEYSRAAAHRMGQALIEFGDALMASERPAELSEEDLFAYDEVLAEQSFEFYDRGVKVWSDLLHQVGKANEDPGQWLAKTREQLWPRLSDRFLYRPEVEYPLVVATPPDVPLPE